MIRKDTEVVNRLCRLLYGRPRGRYFRTSAKGAREIAGNEREARAYVDGNLNQDNFAVFGDYFFILISYLDRSSAQGNARQNDMITSESGI